MQQELLCSFYLLLLRIAARHSLGMLLSHEENLLF